MSEEGKGKSWGIDPNLMRSFTSPLVPDIGKQIQEQQRRQTAVWSVEKLAEEIHDFEAGLDKQHEIGVYLASFGSRILMNLRSVKSIQPNLIVFEGVLENEERSKLIQHMSQLSVLFTAICQRCSSPTLLYPTPLV